MADRPLSVQYLSIAKVGAGATNMVLGQAGYVIEMIALYLNADGNVTVTLQDQHTSLVDIFLGNQVQVVWPASAVGWMRTASGDTLQASLNVDAVNVWGRLVYRLVPDHAEY